MRQIETERLILRAFQESDYDDLFEFLSQLREDEFEGYPGITYENGREHLRYRMENGTFYAIVMCTRCWTPIIGEMGKNHKLVPDLSPKFGVCDPEAG